MLTENVHYETVVIEPGKFVYEGCGGPPWGYCADIFDGKAVVLRRTHPDTDSEEIQKLGDRLRTMRIVRNQKSKRLANRTDKS